MANVVNFKGGSSSGGSLSGDALPEDVLDGKTYYSDSIDLKTGTVENPVGLVPYDLMGTPAKYKVIDNELSGYQLRNFSVNYNDSIVNFFSHICYSKELGRYVAIPEFTSDVYISSDCINWTKYLNAVPLVYTVFECLIYSNNLFVIVGDDGVIATSSDGITWTKRTSPVSVILYSVTYGLGYYVVVGEGGTIITSPDGITWTLRTSPVTTTLYSVSFGNAIFAIMGAETVALSSSDGINWVLRVCPNTMANVCFSNGRFIATGYLSGLMSISGTVWDVVPLPNGISVRKVVSGTSLFYAIQEAPGYPSYLSLITSPDGITWNSCFDSNLFNIPVYSVVEVDGVAYFSSHLSSLDKYTIVTAKVYLD